MESPQKSNGGKQAKKNRKQDKNDNGGKQAKENRKQDQNDCKYKVKVFKISVASVQRLFPPFPLLKLGSFSSYNSDRNEQVYF